jgi:hypothetical protein
MNNANTGPIPTGLGSTAVSREAEMAAFDELDPAIQNLIRVSPVNFCAFEILQLQKNFGAEATLQQGISLIKRTFPDWTPI